MPSLYRRPDYRRLLPIRSGFDEGHAPSWRTPFRRDLARLIHSPAFRRLQGKTQLFAGLESDFFRNRLTHSMEVAQIAKTIGLKLNAEHDLGLDLDLLEFAALAHDLGHPPFGHTGEEALNQRMRGNGGFEGNAQSLRILTRLEKKLDDLEQQLGSSGIPTWYQNGEDVAYGLNLCARSLASILKYDEEIPSEAGEGGLKKGYYQSEAPVVERVRRHVLGGSTEQPLKVIECQIMDLADDIAYSTYDLEDAFKGGLLNPLDLLFPPEEVLDRVLGRARQETGNDSLDVKDVREALDRRLGFFKLPLAEQAPAGTVDEWYADQLGYSYQNAQEFANSGFHRTLLTSHFVAQAIHAVELEPNPRQPALSKVRLAPETRLEVAVLKHLTYVLLISSSRFKLVAYRGTQIVEKIFDALVKKPDLLTPDVRQRWDQADMEHQRLRVVCDFIAGMTDRYAVEFYARLTSDDFHTMFKPL